MEVREKLIQLKDLVENRLSELLPAEAPELLRDSMMYSLLAGGKRLRPAMHLLAAELVDGQVEQCLDMACAIEMIHTYVNLRNCPLININMRCIEINNRVLSMLVLSYD